ncbi:hypothetical protein EPJ69_03370 [Brachyspira aalborgi]|uniref:Lipocalin-like domain-containing protein n=1 Tax=Brachyspira aalborgi TaxID=29522 RepID=A0A5C8E7D8_9SPIR|nr:hypothetical protein [Brachyspira aalborgi]TXJ33997.1 hypothetical protein EPJ69_03370 [Brachyspira aalborgi]
MKNSKNKKLFTYMVVGALFMALSISCKSNEEPEVNRLHSNHPPAGNYKESLGSATATVTITYEGACNIKGTAYNESDTNKKQNYDVTITKWYRGDGSDLNSFNPRVGGNGEGTVTTPSDNTYFNVFYVSDGIITLSFDYNGVSYVVSALKKVN